MHACLLTHDDEARAIGEAGSHFIASRLSLEENERYFELLLREYAKLCAQLIKGG